MLDKIKRYFRSDLWNFPLSKETGWRRFWVKWTRLSYLAVRGFHQDHCSLSASSLTYYTLMAIVPVLAMAFAIARGFGYHETLRAELLNRFQDQNTALTELFKYADTFLEQARGGVIAGVGLVLLFLTVALLLSNLEGILNQIWGVKKLRSWRRILSDYFALMLIAPIFFVFASSVSVFLVDQLEIGIRLLPLSSWASSWLLFFVNVIPYCLFWFLFTFVYLFMPNTAVRLRSACLGGFVAGCVYLVVQWGYIYFQIGVNRYGAIYGSMAALPLFLIWLQVSWFLFLFGAEITYAHQTLEEHEFEAKINCASHSFKRLVTLWIAHLALKKGFLTLELLVQRYQIPTALAKPILQELIDCELLFESRGGYAPAHGFMEMKISDLVNTLDSKGEKDFPFIDTKALAPFERALEQFRQQIESSPHNIRLSHVPHQI
jgi:membrane protein